MFNTNWKGYRTAAWAGQGLLAIAIAVSLFRAQWLSAASLTGYLVASFLFVKFERKLPALFDLIFIVAALINAGGWAWDLYNKPGPYDEIAHFYTIFAITLATGYMLYNEVLETFFRRRWLFVLTIASLGIALGALWEVAEWLVDFAVPKQIVSGLTDTITDIILDSAGAIVAALLNLWGLHEHSQAGQKAGQPGPRAAVAPASKRP